jgi:propionyl-CoA carboxylase alpha chain
LIAGARHLEVQILGDSHGNIIHLGERECSIQRRHQKIIEEAPSPGIDDVTRAALCDGAVALARHVGYENAGTVEFLVGGDGTVGFLEVNTRLQVEHPVTEAVTGIDLVEQQLRIAAGERLPFRQQDVTHSGHAIEARIVAEDPSAGWLPSVGIIGKFNIGGEVRVDQAVAAGSRVSADYDSLLAKVIAHGASRGDAIARLESALRAARISGPATNLRTLIAIVGDADFQAAATPLAYLADHPGVTQAPEPQGDDLLALLLGAVFAREQRDRLRDAVTGFAPSGWRNLRTVGQRQSWRCGDEVHHVEYVIDGTIARVRVGEPPILGEDGAPPVDERRIVAVRLLDRRNDRQALEIDGIRTVVTVRLDGDAAETYSAAGAVVWRRIPRFVDHEAAAAGSGPVAPLPGTVIEVAVAPGAQVATGDLLVVVEAMKMEHRITASRAAEIVAVRCAVGDRVDAGDLLVELHHL